MWTCSAGSPRPRSKILAAYPIKAIGRTTLGPMLHALKIKLIVVPDDQVIWADNRAADASKDGACSPTMSMEWPTCRKGAPLRQSVRDAARQTRQESISKGQGAHGKAQPGSEAESRNTLRAVAQA
jgi:hypothetical protein